MLKEFYANNGIEEYGVYDANDIDDDTYSQHLLGVNRVNTNQSVTTMGDVDRSGVIDPNVTTTTDPTIGTTGTTNADRIVIEPRDNV